LSDGGYVQWDSEAYVVGAAFQDSAAVEASQLTPEHFTDPNLRIIFEAQVALRGAGASIDVAGVIGQIDRLGGPSRFNQAALTTGGWADPAAFVEDCPTFATDAYNVEHHGARVRTAARARALRDLLAAVPEKAVRTMSEGGFDDAAIDSAAEVVVSAMMNFARGAPREHRHTLTKATRAAVERVQMLYDSKGDPVAGVTPWGIECLDDVLPAMEDGELYGLCARSGEGKTMVAWQIARRSALATGRICDFFTAEVDARGIATRHLSDFATVDGRQLQTGQLTDGEIARLLQAVKRTGAPDGPGDLVEIHDAAPTTIEYVASTLRIIEATRAPERKGGLVVVDYWQRLKTIASTRGMSREQVLNHMAGELKTLAQIIRRPILLLAQLNREAYRQAAGRARPDHIRESSGQEHECTTLLGFHWPSKIGLDAPEDYCEVYAMEGRTGASGLIPLKHVGKYQRVEPWQGDPWQGGGGGNKANGRSGGGGWS